MKKIEIAKSTEMLVTLVDIAEHCTLHPQIDNATNIVLV